jgi:hypothetical protein
MKWLNKDADSISEIRLRWRDIMRSLPLAERLQSFSLKKTTDGATSQKKKIFSGTSNRPL